MDQIGEVIIGKVLPFDPRLFLEDCDTLLQMFARTIRIQRTGCRLLFSMQFVQYCCRLDLVNDCGKG